MQARQEIFDKVVVKLLPWQTRRRYFETSDRGSAWHAASMGLLLGHRCWQTYATLSTFFQSEIAAVAVDGIFVFSVCSIKLHIVHLFLRSKVYNPLPNDPSWERSASLQQRALVFTLSRCTVQLMSIQHSELAERIHVVDFLPKRTCCGNL